MINFIVVDNLGVKDVTVDQSARGRDFKILFNEGCNSRATGGPWRAKRGMRPQVPARTFFIQVISFLKKNNIWIGS